MKNLFVLTAIALTFLLSACSENSTGPAENGSFNKSSVQHNLSSAASENNSEEVPTAEYPEESEGILTMPNGALVKIIYYYGEIQEVEGLTGPYDYELYIGKDLIPYQDARKIVLNAIKAEIIYWYFEKDKTDRIFEYRFIVLNNEKYEVRINAFTGEIIKIN